MNIRSLTEADIPRAAAIVGRNYNAEDERFATLELQEMFGTSVVKPTFLVAEDEGRILGFAGFAQTRKSYHIYGIFWVNVDPEYQGHSIGKQLVERVIEEIKKLEDACLILLTTRNPSYYAERFGFSIIGSFKDNTESLMSLSLEGK